MVADIKDIFFLTFLLLILLLIKKLVRKLLVLYKALFLPNYKVLFKLLCHRLVYAQ